MDLSELPGLGSGAISVIKVLPVLEQRNSVIRIPLSSLIAPAFYDLYYEVKHDLYDEFWLKGGRGSTKSTFVSIMIVLGLLQDPNANAVVLRRYQNELRDTVYGQFIWTIHKMGLQDEFNFRLSPLQIEYRKTGQVIIFRGADNPRKMKSINLGRGYVKYAWFEEADQYASMDEIRMILQSLFRGENRRRIVFFSYNPPKSGRFWINQEVRIRHPRRRVHHSTYLQVPREWLGDRFLADAETLKETNEMAYRHEYLGEEIGTGLEVFTNVVTEEITDEFIARCDNIRQGLDFGYAASPLAFERLHYDSTRRRLYFLDEIQGLRIFNRELFDRVQKKGYHRTLTIADSEEPKSIEELRSLGMLIKGAKKGPDSVDYGIRFLQDLDAIVIDPNRTPLAAREFINYALEVDRAGNVKQRFPDKDNHSIDAARYALEDDMVRKKAGIWGR